MYEWLRYVIYNKSKLRHNYIVGANCVRPLVSGRSQNAPTDRNEIAL